MLLAGAFVMDMLPRVVTSLRPPRRNCKSWSSSGRRALDPRADHAGRPRRRCFYIAYVSYRNLKSFLPFIIETKYDRELHLSTGRSSSAHEPAVVLHNVFGETFSAHLLSTIYLWFLPLVPLA